jgi:hypothetical protein
MDADMPPQSIKNGEGYGIVYADHIKFIPKRNIFMRTAITFFLDYTQKDV